MVEVLPRNERGGRVASTAEEAEAHAQEMYPDQVIGKADENPTFWMVGTSGGQVLIGKVK